MDKNEYSDKLLYFRALIDSCFSIANRIPEIVEKERATVVGEEKADKIVLLDFFNRFQITLISLWRIFQSTLLEEFKYPDTPFDKGVELVDFPSAFVLVRTLFENYINMHYICDSVDKDERELRKLFWRRYSLTEREALQARGMALLLPSFSQNTLETIDNKIKSNNQFKKLARNKRDHRKILSVVQKDRWSLIPIHEKAEKAGIKEDRSRLFYKILSDYAHSGPLSIDIGNLIKNASIARKEMVLAQDLAKIFLSLTVYTFGENWGGAVKELINKEPLLIAEINKSRKALEKGINEII